MQKTHIAVLLVGAAGVLFGTAVFMSSSATVYAREVSTPDVSALLAQIEVLQAHLLEAQNTNATNVSVPAVPFYSQFTDIVSSRWQKVGCGIASTAMIIDYYADNVESVESLLTKGITAGAFLETAGWTHAGLINLTKPYGMTGESKGLQQLGVDEAFAVFSDEVSRGPVMASVHYTFESTNPIPHLVVITGIEDGLVHYNDPAEAAGGGTLSVEKFKAAWKQKYIVIRPV